MQFQFRILGDLEVHRDGLAVPLGSPKQRSFLSALLLDANRPVSLDQLERLLWDASPPRSAVANLRTYAAGLRSIVGGRVSALSGAYRIAVRPAELDLSTYGDLVAAGRAAMADDPANAANSLSQALGLWRGPAGLDLPAGTLLRGRVESLNEERLLVIEDHFSVRLELGEHSQLVGELRRFLADHPVRERAWRHLMLALYRCGDVAGSLAAFQQAGAALSAELGLDPGPELRALQKAILQGDSSLTGEAVLVLPRQADRAGQDERHRARFPTDQLPAGPEHFVGRDAELAAIITACRRRRGARPAVVLIHGPPGAGKSALAVRAAQLVAADHPDGRLYADLHGTGDRERVDPERLLWRFLRDLGDQTAVTGLDDAGVRYRSQLSGQRMLILLDGATDARQILTLLPGNPGCTVLVTCRRRFPVIDAALRIELDVLAPAAAAAFLTQAIGDRRTIEDPSGTAAVVRLCGQLPLALRIAAAKLANRPDWSPSYLADRLADESSRISELAIDGLAVRDSIGAAVAELRTPSAGTGALALRVLETVGRMRAATFDGRTVAEALNVSVADARRALELLCDACLIAVAGSDTYQIHDLVSLFAAGLSSSSE